MQHNLAVHNANSADFMPMWSTHAANPNDLMSGVHNMHSQASQPSILNLDAPQSTYWSSMHTCQLSTTKINCITFSGTNYPKCKLEHAHDGSHCTTQC